MSVWILEVEYLGNIISGRGVSVDPKKIESIKTWTKPRTIKEIWGFLGANPVISYYHKFIKDYGKIAKPPNKLLKKEIYQWSADSRVSFEELKSALSSAPFLRMSNFNLTFVID